MSGEPVDGTNRKICPTDAEVNVILALLAESHLGSYWLALLYI